MVDRDIRKALLEQLPGARARGRAAERAPSWPVAVRYRRAEDSIIVTLRSGFSLIVPRNKLTELKNASAKQLAQVELMGAGLHWEELDVDIGVPGLIADAIGPNALATEMGRLGGSVTSKAKAAAARANGAKGGRPKKKAS